MRRHHIARLCPRLLPLLLDRKPPDSKIYLGKINFILGSFGCLLAEGVAVAAAVGNQQTKMFESWRFPKESFNLVCPSNVKSWLYARGDPQQKGHLIRVRENAYRTSHSTRRCVCWDRSSFSRHPAARTFVLAAHKSNRWNLDTCSRV